MTTEIAITSPKMAKLIAALYAAKRAAIAVVNSKLEDGGTSNFDSLAIGFASKKASRESDTAVTKEEVDIALKHVGLRGRIGCGKMWRNTFLVSPVIGGYQGYVRTKQAEVMAKVLEDLGYKTVVYYQMD